MNKKTKNKIITVRLPSSSKAPVSLRVNDDLCGMLQRIRHHSISEKVRRVLDSHSSIITSEDFTRVSSEMGITKQQLFEKALVEFTGG